MRQQPTSLLEAFKRKEAPVRKRECYVQLLYFSDLLPDKYPEDSANLFRALEKYRVAYGFIKGAKDIRIRDFMPIQIRGRFKRDNVLFRYEPSYLKNHRDLQTDFFAGH